MKLAKHCDHLPCLENARPEAIGEGDALKYRYQNCSQDSGPRGVQRVGCDSWRITRDAMTLTPHHDGTFSTFSLFMDIALHIVKPVAAFRIYSDGDLMEDDRVVVKIDGVEVYQWTATKDTLSLKGIPMPAIPLHSGPLDFSIEFVRPLDSLGRSRSSKAKGAVLNVESVAFFSESLGSTLSSESHIDEAQQLNKDNKDQPSKLGIDDNQRLTLVAAILLGFLPIFLLIIFLRRFLFMLISYFCCSCCQNDDDDELLHEPLKV